jgi:hypothetical protein
VADHAQKPLGQLRLETNDEPFSKSWLAGLPPLPPAHSPEGTLWSDSLAICAMMKDEQFEDIVEWLQYYRCAAAIGG